MLHFRRATRDINRFSNVLRRQTFAASTVASSSKLSATGPDNCTANNFVPIPTFPTIDPSIYASKSISVLAQNSDSNYFDDQPNLLNNPPNALNNRARRRIALSSSRITAGIQKRRTISSVQYRGLANRASTKSATKEATATPNSNKSNGQKSVKTSGRITWRDSLKSPRNALKYLNQLRVDLIGFFQHMWAGIKLLGADVRVSFGILRRITNGKQISRRERNFLTQTGVDLARFVPFSLFLIIPALEFLLPVILIIFPNMLPSQFQDSMKREENLKRQLKGRIEFAKYISDVVQEKARLVKKSSEVDSELQQEAESLDNFIDAIRSGKPVDSAEVSKFARLFNDEITIDGAARPQLVAMCKYMGLSQYGHDQFLRFKLRSRLKTIKNDDMQITWEGGVNSLTDDEVIKACQDRGIQTINAQKKDLRAQLSDWLVLSRQREIPGSLLIMSRAFFYSEADGIKESLGSLPADVIDDVKAKSDVTTVERLEEAQRQAKLIAIESEAEERKEREDEEKRKKKEQEETAEAEATAEAGTEEGTVEAEKHEAELRKEFFEAKPGDGASDAPDETPTAEPSDKATEEMGEEEKFEEQNDMRKLLVSLGELASESAVEKEREELEYLKGELAEAEALVKASGTSTGLDLRRFKTTIKKLEREVERVDAVVGLRMKLLDKDNDGLMSFEECKNIMSVIAGSPDDDLVTETLRRLDADADGNISRADLKRLLNEIQGEASALSTSDEN